MWYDWPLMALLLVLPLGMLYMVFGTLRELLTNPHKATPSSPRLGVIAGLVFFLLVVLATVFYYHYLFIAPYIGLGAERFHQQHGAIYTTTAAVLILAFIPLFCVIAYKEVGRWWSGISPSPATPTKLSPNPPNIAPEALATPTSRQEYTEAVMTLLQLPPLLVNPVREAVYKYTDSDEFRTRHTPNEYLTLESIRAYNAPERLAANINSYAGILPPHIKKIGVGKPWKEFWSPEHQHRHYHYLDIPEYLRLALDSIQILISIPLEARKENHIHILAKSRWGKTQLLQSLILDTVEAGIPIIVIDSQEQMINKLATRIPDDNLILVDPIQCPPGINPFDLDNDAASLALLPYMFGGIGSPLIGRQITVFRWLSRLIVEAKGDMKLLYRFLKEPELPLAEYRHIIEQMGIPGQSFFDEYKKHEKPKGEYKDTRDELVRRLDTILGDPTFAQMLLAPKTTIDIAQAISDGKTILISTAKPQTGPDAAALIGRFFISQVLRAAMKAKTRVVLVCDEFRDYAEDTQPLFDILSQSLKYGLELVVAHQALKQLPEGLKAELMTNAAIKLAGGVSAEDRANVARQMDCEPEFIAATKKGTFAAKIGDAAPIHLPVEFGRLEAMPEISRLDDIYAAMSRYSPPLPTHTPKTPDIEPRVSGGVGKSFDVDC